MKILITGAAGNLGSHLARYLLNATDYQLNLMTHTTPLANDLQESKRTKVYSCDLNNPQSLDDICSNSDVIVHFAGVLFAPNPEKFLPITNTQYAVNLIDKAIQHKLKRFILISFPHVEGPTTQSNPSTNRLDGNPVSVHAKTRLAEEQYLFSKKHSIEAISLRAGMIYGRDILMVAYARKLAQKYLLGVWRNPTAIHLISIDDFLSCCLSAIQNTQAAGIYPLGDDFPTTLQKFLEAACQKWKLKKPWQVPLWSVYMAAWLCEKTAALLGTKTPFTRDFIDIGRVSYYCDTSRMKTDLLPRLKYPSLDEGRVIL